MANHHYPVDIDKEDCNFDTPSSPHEHPSPSPLSPAEFSPQPTASLAIATRPTVIEPTSWAAKNPDLLIAPTKTYHTVESWHPASTEVSSATIKKRLAKEKRDVFADDLLQGMEDHQQRLKEIAMKHGKKVNEVMHIAGSSSRYKGHRAVSDLQVKLQYQVKENNEEKLIREKMRLAELLELAKTDPRCEEMSKDELQSLKEEGVAEDYHRTADLIKSALISLGHHTGAHGFAVLSQGSVDDIMQLCLLQIPGSTQFLLSSIKVDPC
ncbi:uncharacterized protein ARMOST_03185 [Armillaria ostoyae]|uniref:Uncharacterized protein n=1 Tax=Armillaria ostoyae TaxID=47428 RepID=A0A284QTQ9_ARMOS|nr:uncharacterized protein ARMOST_03185 [Armillaria ostoyae]